MYLQEQIASLLRSAVIQAETEPYHEVLQYIEFNGTQYFDTGYYGNQNTTWEAECRATSTSNYGVVIGARTATNQNRIDLIYSTDGTSGWMGFGTNNNNTYNFKSLPANVRHNFKCDEGNVYIDGELKDTITHSNFGTPVTLKIGCEDTNGTLSMGFVGELYVLKLNGSDYVPVLDSQMRPCLYDKISKTFLYAKKIEDGTDATSTLTFKRWNKFDVDYISSSGTEYITTNIFPDQDTAIECTARIDTWGYSPTQYPTYHSTNVFGSGSVSSTDAYTFGIGTPSTLTMGRRGGVAITGMDASLNTKYVIYQDKNGASYNDISLTYDSTPPSVKATTNPLTFFRNPLSNTIGNLSMYGARVWQSNNLILSLKPVVWHSSNTTAVACLYDEVYNKMYQNAGTGSFKAYIQNGSDVYEVGKSVSGTPSGSVSSASNCFDTGLYGTQDTTVKYIGVGYDNNSTSGQLFGSYDGTTSTSKNLTINSTGSSGNTAPIRFDGQVITTPIRIATDQSVSIVNSKYGLWVNDSLHGSWGSVSDFTTLTTLLILKCNNSVNVRNNGCGYCLILEKDEIVAEYIPVKNGNAIGLYDTVSKTVNTGVGTINFNVLD